MEDKNRLFDGIKKRSFAVFGISYKKLTVLLLGIVGLGVYLGILLFGENSLVRYIHLKEQVQQMRELKQQLRQNNAQLQKEYFELKEIQPKEEK